jgi:hypothetical protein
LACCSFRSPDRTLSNPAADIRGATRRLASEAFTFCLCQASRAEASFLTIAFVTAIESTQTRLGHRA